MRALATVVCSVVMALAAIGLAVAAPGRDHDPARASLGGASGALAIGNSHEGDAVFAAGDMRPGQGVTGAVTIGNDGDVAGRFTVAATNIVDVAGPNGGLLSQRLELALFDVTDPDDPVSIFVGHPADFADYDVGTLEPGEDRDFLFTATLPDGGVPPTATTGDNSYQHSRLTLGFAWTAVNAGTVIPTPTPTPRPKPTPKPKPKPKPKPTPTATPTPTPTPTLSIADQLGLPPATTCVKRSKLKFKLKAPAGTKLKSAVVTVNGKTKARLKGRKLKKAITLRGLRKTTKLKVTVRTTGKRTFKASRTYKACKKRKI
jgi:hypothetical protein